MERTSSHVCENGPGKEHARAPCIRRDVCLDVCDAAGGGLGVDVDSDIFKVRWEVNNIKNKARRPCSGDKKRHERGLRDKHYREEEPGDADLKDSACELEAAPGTLHMERCKNGS